ncbi:velvet factor-domain-containing protein [Naematelia encephala]|uniref:Velvet factor-domain-containing protein n=1 Tax=Naematelia encephala TaxID=71784 RepID=A0A1Y2B454_9TREE|nr:velvet factor-domain-containing protein [Naematelia encephala]
MLPTPMTSQPSPPINEREDVRARGNKRQRLSSSPSSSMTPTPKLERQPTPTPSPVNYAARLSVASLMNQDTEQDAPESSGRYRAPNSPTNPEGDDDELDSSDDEDELVVAAYPVAPPTGHQGGVGWTYHLQVIQQPQRARACGFGDKDRRPLSPPPIIRLWVRDSTGQLVDSELIDVNFLILMVDLWSADGEQERNVVMHPSSSQRPLSPRRSISVGVPSEVPSVPGPSRPTTGGRIEPSEPNASSAWPEGVWRWPPRQAPLTAMASPGTSPLSRVPSRDVVPSPPPVPAVTGWSPPRPMMGRAHSFNPHLAIGEPTATRPVTAPSYPLHTPHTPRHHGPHPLHLPPLTAITEDREPPRPASSSLTLPAFRDPIRSSTSTTSSRDTRSSWSTPSGPIPSPDVWVARTGGPSHPWPLSDSRKDNRPSSSWTDRPSTAGDMLSDRPFSGDSQGPPRHYRDPGGEVRLITPNRASFPTPSSFRPRSPSSSRQEVPSFYQVSGDLPYNPMATLSENRPSSSYSAANFSRVLVGSLTAHCQRLSDENDQPGLFFFAHDLGVRTEGLFRLRFTLVNLASLMTAGVTPGTRAPAMAVAYSNRFTVYSAKRFPGVIPTTDLTRLFAAQNVRLPTRQKRAPSGHGEVEDEYEDE